MLTVSREQETKLKEESAPFKLSSAAWNSIFSQQRFIHIYTSPNTDRKVVEKKNLGIAEVNYM